MSYSFEKTININAKCENCDKESDIEGVEEFITISPCHCVIGETEDIFSNKIEKIYTNINRVIENSIMDDSVKADILQKIDIGRITDWD